jgi:hypothetical protein
MWVQEVVAAPDLEALGRVIHHRLGGCVADGPAGHERRLAERLAYEHQVRHYIARANERSYPFARQFPSFANNWVEFVNQNKAAEVEIAKGAERRAYEAGRVEEGIVTTQAASHNQLTILPNSPLLAPHDPLALIRRIVQDEMAKSLPSASAPQAVPANPASQRVDSKADGNAAKPEDRRVSVALAEFLKPADRKRQRTTKGRAEAGPVVQFAVEFLGNPAFSNITPDDWKGLDEALTDIPKTKNIPREQAKTLFQRFKYAEQHGWSELTRITEKTIKAKYWAGLYKFIDWAIAEKFYRGPPPSLSAFRLSTNPWSRRPVARVALGAGRNPKGCFPPRRLSLNRTARPHLLPDTRRASTVCPGA